MSDSEDENENFCYFGKPLDPYDEDSFPKKRPISVEEQIVTDAQGRRRFHGAFTGGFSAGFFNTVGTPEGWTPNEFKSSRTEKAKGAIQKPEDFMDEEDIGEYGIAPQVVRATKDYSTSKKRKKQVFSDGPIPGEPVLHSILKSGNETVGYMLLKNLSIKDKIKTVSDGKVYGCQMPQTYEISEDIDQDQYTIPEIYTEFLTKLKANTFGLGYVGLDKNRFSLFPTQSGSNFGVIDKNKKISKTGQAFGVGAFEEEDDDIYIKDDMTNYDFELSAEKEQKKTVTSHKKLVFDLFIRSVTPLLNNKLYHPPQIPHSFIGKHKTKRSRFEPISKDEEKPSTSKINPILRARYLGEETKNEITESKSLQQTSLKEDVMETASSSNNHRHEISTSNQGTNSGFDIASLYLNDKFISSSKKEDVINILEPVEKFETIHGTDQMREAVRMKMFGCLTRITTDWVPCSLLCKKFNVPEPFIDRPEKTRTRTKNIIFEYQRHAEKESDLKPGLMKENEEINIPITNERIVDSTEEIDNSANTSINPTEIKKESSEENMPIDVTDKINIDKQQDLYKAVFLSSDSESDSEEKKEVEKQSQQSADTSNDFRKEEMKSTVLSDQLLPKIKPLNKGILSGLSFHKFSKHQPKVKEEDNAPKDTDLITPVEPMILSPNYDVHLYGPKVPEKMPINNEENTAVTISSDSEDKWIEKNEIKNKKNKKGKKHKKEKHKKHKHEKKSKKKKKNTG